METTALIKSTELEELVSFYKQDQETHPDSDLNIRRKDEIASQVAEAFEFLRELGKPNSGMTLGEFEIAHSEIKKRAGGEISVLKDKLKRTSRLRFVRRSGLRYLIHGLERSSECGYHSSTTLKSLSAYWGTDLNLVNLVERIFKARYGAKTNGSS